MLIDWWTVGAQVFNFLLLVFLLKRFLYRPILKVMAERERRISDRVEAAQREEEKARLRVLELEQERQAFRDASEGLMAEARSEIEAWREKALQEVRLEVEGLRAAWREGLDREKEAFLARLRDQVARQVLEIGEKALRDLAEEGLERQVVRVFLERVQEEGRSYLKEGRARELEVQSGFPLRAEAAQTLAERLKSWMPEGGSVRFSLEKGLGIGLQVASGEWKVAWNLSHYLDGLEREILRELSSAGRKGTHEGARA